MKLNLDLGVAVAVAVIAIVCVLVLLRWLPRAVARQVVELYVKATKEQERATDAREALQTAARAELGRVVALAYDAEKTRDRATDERAAMQAAAREAIRRAFVDAQGDHVRFVHELRQEFDVASIADELRRNAESGRALLWQTWAVLSEALGGLGLPPPPEPPKFAPRPAVETRPDTQDERRARPPEPAPAVVPEPVSVEPPTDARATWAQPRLPQLAAPDPPADRGRREAYRGEARRPGERGGGARRRRRALRGPPLRGATSAYADARHAWGWSSSARRPRRRSRKRASERLPWIGRGERRTVGFGEGAPETTMVCTAGTGTARRKDGVVAVVGAGAAPDPRG